MRRPRPHQPLAPWLEAPPFTGASQHAGGGHSGGKGMARIAGPGIAAGDDGARSVFDVVPTIIELVGGEAKAGLSGESFRREVEVEGLFSA